MTKRKRTKGQTEKQRSTKHKSKDWTPLKTGSTLKCSRRLSSSCSTSGARRVDLVANPVISHEWGMTLEVFTTSGTYPLSFVTYIFHSIKQLRWVLATLTFGTIKSMRTNTDVISININTSTVILAGGAATWCHCIKYVYNNN
jgi:hypothetical protein